MADKVRMGRSGRGEKNPSARLTSEDVSRIKNRCAGGETRAAVARSFGVSRECVSNVACGRTWKHLDAHVPEGGAQ